MLRSPFSALLHAYGPFSLLKLSVWRMKRSPQALRLRRPDGSWIELRGGRYTQSDRWIASEIFVNAQYVPPTPICLSDVRQIVDVGANVGFSLVYFLTKFPQATATAFEPHPAHVQQIRRHIEMNRLTNRVTLHAAAAATTAGELRLTDSEASSTIISGSDTENTLSVPAVDWFACLPDGTIDLLKIDIEGAEFALMGDTRFADVLRRTRTLTLEWHVTADHPQAQNARNWCAERLMQEGFAVYDSGPVRPDARSGTFWAACPEV